MGNINRSYKTPPIQAKASNVSMGYHTQIADCSGGKGTLGKPTTTSRGNANASKSSNSSSKTNKSVSY